MMAEKKDALKKISPAPAMEFAHFWMLYIAHNIMSTRKKIKFAKRQLLYVFNRTYSDYIGKNHLLNEGQLMSLDLETFQKCIDLGLITSIKHDKGWLQLTDSGLEIAEYVIFFRREIQKEDRAKVKRLMNEYYAYRDVNKRFYGSKFNSDAYMKINRPAILLLGIGEEKNRFEGLPYYMHIHDIKYYKVILLVHHSNKIPPIDLLKDFKQLNVCTKIELRTVDYRDIPSIKSFVKNELDEILPAKIGVAIGGMNKGMVYEILALLSQYTNTRNPNQISSYLDPHNEKAIVTCFYCEADVVLENPGNFVRLKKYNFRNNDSYSTGVIWAEQNGLERMKRYAEIGCKELFVSVPLEKDGQDSSNIANNNADLLETLYDHVTKVSGVDYSEPGSIKTQLSRIRKKDFVGLSGNTLISAIASEMVLKKAISHEKTDLFYAKLDYPTQLFSEGSGNIAELEMKLPDFNPKYFNLGWKQPTYIV